MRSYLKVPLRPGWVEQLPVAVPGDEPGGVVVGDEVLQPAVQVLAGVEAVHPQEVLLRGADEAFRDAVALRLAV